MSSQLKPHDVTCCVIRVELFVNDSCQVFGVTFLREKRCFFLDDESQPVCLD